MLCKQMKHLLQEHLVVLFQFNAINNKKLKLNNKNLTYQLRNWYEKLNKYK